MQHTNKAVDEVRRAEFFRKGGRMRSVVKRLWTYAYESALRYLKSWEPAASLAASTGP